MAQTKTDSNNTQKAVKNRGLLSYDIPRSMRVLQLKENAITVDDSARK